ncbi:MAG: hypothetical protein IT364_21725 [Candidatus Hydrogenedentes bacterium]|nr:hypothetical protein [Candidatus Hydrogenedentota bacterium]
MMGFAFHFAGGAAFYPGLLCAIAGLTIACFASRRVIAAPARIVTVLGALLVILSATPSPLLLYLSWSISLAMSLVARPRKDSPKKRRQYATLAVAALLTVAMGVMEWPYRMRTSIPYRASGVLYELGDSLSMGADTLDGNWPALLADKAGMRVKSFAFGGARLQTALSNADRVESDASLIIVELGGNDIFYDTSSKDFAQNLDAMLTKLAKHQAPVVLLELPLPPFYNAFGAAQRRLANQHGAILVPKSVLATVLATPGATADGLHLSPAGHALLADTLWSMRG